MDHVSRHMKLHEVQILVSTSMVLSEHMFINKLPMPAFTYNGRVEWFLSRIVWLVNTAIFYIWSFTKVC